MQNIDQFKQISDNNLVSHVRKKLQNNKVAGPIWIGYSGGCDSHVLLDVISKILPKQQIIAIHINHNISTHAKIWEEHCHKLLKNMSITAKVQNAYPLDGNGANLEDKARQARFNIFCKEIPENGTLLLAHHLDDQVETILMRMFKGAGPTGISGINEYYKYKNINILRPLLDVSKDKIKTYANDNKLNWVEDDSNNNCKHDRNHIRNIVIPSLTTKWPALKHSIIRTAEHCREQNQYLQQQSKSILATITTENNLNIQSLIQHDKLLQKLIIRNWLQTNGSVTPSTKHIEIIFSEIITAKQDKQPQIQISNIKIRRHQDKLYIIHAKNKSYPQNHELAWLKTDQSIALPLSGKKLVRNCNLKQGSVLQDELIIRFRQGGERFHPSTRVGSHPLKKLLQEWGVPPWERNKIPLLYFKNELVCIPGYAVAKKYFSGNCGHDAILVERL